LHGSPSYEHQGQSQQSRATGFQRKKRYLWRVRAESCKTRTVKPVPIKFAQHQTMALNDVADPGISETAASKMCSCLCEAAAG